MAAPKIQTREAWTQRALELAAERHTDGTARLLCGDRWRRVYAVRKGSSLGDYLVVMPTFDGRVTCDCIAGQHGRPCAHAGAAIGGERQRAAAEISSSSRRSEAWDWWMHGGEW